MPRSGHESHILPPWVWDIDEEDDVQQDLSILEELNIDIPLIAKTAKWSMIYPFQWCFLSFLLTPQLHPLSTPSSQQEFWGPFGVVCLYGMILWLAELPHSPWVLVIWMLATTFSHIVGRNFLQNSSFSIHSVILGYSVTNLIPIAILSIIFKKEMFLMDILKFISIVYATISAFITNLHICFISASAKESTRYLLVMPTFLMHIYMISLIPRQ